MARPKIRGVKRYTPERRRLQFDEVTQDHFGEFFERHFAQLMIEVHTLASGAFCPEDQLKVPALSPWLRDLSGEFLQYVELVARSDPSARQWETLLYNNTERGCLLQAIIMKILDVEVFSSLLFGADLHHQSSLKSADVSLVNTEGFRRSDLRGHNNRLYLETMGGEPPLFWEEVDKLSSRVLSLIKPVFEWTGKIKGWESGAPSIDVLYRWVHDVIAYAGWLNVCIQTSPDIIAINWTTPGERHQFDQVNFAHEVYKSSQASAQKHDEHQMEIDSSAVVPKRAPRVKISMAPHIVHYMAAADVHGTTGIETYTVMQPHVVYYQGWDDDIQDAKSLVSLPAHMKKLRDQNSVPHGVALLIMLVVALVIWVTCVSSGYNAWSSVKETMAEVGVEGSSLLSVVPVSSVRVLQPVVEAVRFAEGGGHVAASRMGIIYVGGFVAAFTATRLLRPSRK